jgi:hypothetical protein
MGSGQKVGSRQMLGGKHAIHGLQRKLALAAQEVRQMRLSQSGLPRQQRDAERPPLNPAEQFQAESLVHLREVHLWKIRHRQ